LGTELKHRKIKQFKAGILEGVKNFDLYFVDLSLELGFLKLLGSFQEYRALAKSESKLTDENIETKLPVMMVNTLDTPPKSPKKSKRAYVDLKVFIGFSLLMNQTVYKSSFSLTDCVIKESSAIVKYLVDVSYP
jgi:hypothetical protein